MLIVLWGVPGDSPLARVEQELDAWDIPTAWVNQHALLRSEIHLCANGAAHGWIRTPEDTIELDEVTALYARPQDVRSLPMLAGCTPASVEWQHVLTFEDILWSWAELSSARVVNRMSAMWSNGSKPYQAEIIRRFFRVPATLLTTDPNAAREFWQTHGEVIYKSVSGVRSIVARLRAEDEARLDDVAFCPTQFQQYIRGVDYRVHVVGDAVFAAEIASDANDYRYAGAGAVEIHACELPRDVVHRCQQLADALALPVAGIDLRLSDDGAWYCFEVNPSPGYTFYQAHTGQPISVALAQYLIQGDAEN